MSQEIFLPHEVRRSLLEDHVRLRRLLDELEELAARVRGGDDVGRLFSASARRLLHELDRHNATEEGVLEPLLRRTDAWGVVRVYGMFAEHQEEHAALAAMLQHREASQLARAIPRLSEDLRAHMAREEVTFLAGDVLSDALLDKKMIC